MIACAVAAIASAAANPDSAEDQYVHVWRGEGLNAWKNANMSRNVRVEDGMLKLGSTGWDSFITGPAIDLAPKADQEVVFTAKVSVGGRGQLFWSRPQDPAPLERFAREFEWIADGRFHTYRVRPYWQGAGKVVRLRLDFPPRAARTASGSSLRSASGPIRITASRGMWWTPTGTWA